MDTTSPARATYRQGTSGQGRRRGTGYSQSHTHLCRYRLTPTCPVGSLDVLAAAWLRLCHRVPAASLASAAGAVVAAPRMKRPPVCSAESHVTICLKPPQQHRSSTVTVEWRRLWRDDGNGPTSMLQSKCFASRRTAGTIDACCSSKHTWPPIAWACPETTVACTNKGRRQVEGTVRGFGHRSTSQSLPDPWPIIGGHQPQDKLTARKRVTVLP